MKHITLFVATLFFAAAGSVNAQSFELLGPTYPSGRVGYDTLYAVMFDPSAEDYLLGFNTQTLTFSARLDGPGSFGFYRQANGNLPLNETVNLEAHLLTTGERYLVVRWTGGFVPETAQLIVWTETDTTIVHITAIPVPPDDLVCVSPVTRDTTPQGTILCRDRHFVNYTGKPITITNFNLHGVYRILGTTYIATHYTIANMPTLPLTIPDRDSLVLSICYTPPFAGEFDEDSLEITEIVDGVPRVSIFMFYGLSLEPSTVRRTIPETLSLYPNPASDVLVVTGLPQSYHRVRVIDALGRHVMEAEIDGTNFLLNIAALQPGHYTLEVAGHPTYTFIKTEK